MPDPRFEPATPFTDQDINDIQKHLGRELPEDYRRFVKEFGGAFIGGEIEGPKRTSILGLFEADEYKGPSSLIMTYADLCRAGSFPFADCEFGNPYILNAADEVYYIDYTNGDSSPFKVAGSFRDFISHIVIEEESEG